MGLITSKSKEEFDVGDDVYIKSTDQNGYIVSKEGNNYKILLNRGQFVEINDVNDLELC